MNTKQMLDQLADFQAQEDYLHLLEEEQIDAIMTDEQKKQVEDIKAEFAIKAGAVSENILELQANIKEQIIETGESVKGEVMTLTHEENQVACEFKRGGYPGGSFIRALIKTIVLADAPNSRKLHSIWPEYVDAVKGYQTGKKLNGQPSDFLERLNKQ